MTNTNKMKRAAWNCEYCHATNVTARCGCEASRLTVENIPTIEFLNAIVLVIPRKARKG